MKVVWLAAYPRSGVTFLRLMIERLYGLPTYTHCPDEWKATGRLFPGGRLFPHDVNGMPIVFVKTHGVPAEGDKALVIHLVRDPRDVLISYAHYLRDVHEDPRTILELLSEILGGYPHGRWCDHTEAWLAQPAQRIHFDALVADPVNAVIGAVDAMGLDLPRRDAEPPSFAALQREHPKFFRSGRTGQWQAELPRHVLKRFEREQGDAIAAYEEAFGSSAYGERS